MSCSFLFVSRLRDDLYTDKTAADTACLRDRLELFFTVPLAYCRLF